MGIQEIKFSGLIQNRKLTEITGPEFFNALSAVGWKEGTGTHFFQQLRKDGPSRGINTPADLSRAISLGTSEIGRDGTTVHRICSDSAYLVFNSSTRTLITFSQGSPPKFWDLEKSLSHLRLKALPPYGKGLCATFVREAIEAGGISISRAGSGSAKDYGQRLTQAGFTIENTFAYKKGDIAVIDGFLQAAAPGIKKDHVDGHVAMYDGVQWISDFKQTGISPYPGTDYEKAKPKFVIYRHKSAK